jgi:hypothetical protein
MLWILRQPCQGPSSSASVNRCAQQLTPAVNIFFSDAKKFQCLAGGCSTTGMLISAAPMLVELSYSRVLLLLDAPD